ncbi:MAG: long-chain-fatty-acid--CoA ligase [Roseovarius sp.]
MQCQHFGVWPEGLPRGLPPSPNSIFDNLVASARRYPEQVAIKYYGKELSYRELLQQVEHLAGYLHDHADIRTNDRVALYMQNAPQFVISYYAILAANAVIVPINPMCKRAELRHILQDANARAVIFGQELEAEIGAVESECNNPALISACYSEYHDLTTDLNVPAIVKATGPAKVGVRWSEALKKATSPPLHTRKPEDWCIIPYSSGTTGRPKGCLHTHASVNATVHAYPGWVGVQDGSQILATLPFCHVTGMQHSMNLPILTGSTIHLMTRWNAETAAWLIERERVQHWRSITTMMIDFLSLDGVENRDLSSLQAVGGGGAQMPESVARKMTDLIGLDYIEAYGLTETMAPIHINPVHAPREQCLGIPIFDVDSRIIDPNTAAELGPNDTGEIITHAPQLFQGYWRRPEDTAAAMLELEGKQFFRTGDIGYYDDQGYFYFVDRLKRMINVSGLKVWPAEVEAILHSHPDISEACIVGDVDPRTGESVRAVIVLSDENSGLDNKSLEAWCRENMAAYKVPRRFETRNSLPRSAAGKVLWKDL